MMDRGKNWFSSDSSRGLSLIGLPFGFSLLLLAAPMLLIFFLGFWTQDYLVLDRSFSPDNYIEAWTEPIYRDLML
jgi:spermidine/putrescine transport system permease protein